jgi:hypothetical protein
MTNTLAYFIAVVIVAVKSFIEHDPGDQKPPASLIKLYSLSPMVQKDKLEYFLIFTGKTGPYTSGALRHSLTANIRQG